MTALPIVLGINFLGLIVVILLLWRVSVAIHDVSFIDSFWAFGMILVATATMAQVGIGGTGGRLLLGLVLLWGLRLSWHLFLRWRREGEDPRYARIIGDAVERKGLSWPRAALIMAWLMQAPLLFITCLPVQIGIWASAAEPLQAVGAMGWVGVALALGGLVFEGVGDAQLRAFRADPATKGRVLDTGLWRYTRHPNYFGDAMTWWGIWLLAADAGLWVGLASLIGPLFLTFTLTRWSGKALLEKGLHKTRPAYADYVQRTSGFFPWPPKKA